MTCIEQIVWATVFLIYLIPDTNGQPHCGHPPSSHPSWGPWHSWSTCHVDCSHSGTATQSRIRHCMDTHYHCILRPSYCGMHIQTRSCPNTCQSTPVDGAWGPWQHWGGCSRTCGPGAVKQRHRHCDRPAPQLGGLTCLGESSSTTECHVADCVTSGSTARPTSAAVDGQWGPWGSWTSCSQSCGTGVRSKYRLCNNPAPQNGGARCPKHSKKYQSHCYMPTCPVDSAPVDGAWGPWQHWGGCSRTCGTGGVKERHRDCDRPAPQHGGHTCTGLSSSNTTCHVEDCFTSGSTAPTTQVAVEWSAWSEWITCSSTCGNGSTIRARHCGTHNQTTCPGYPFDTKQCTERACVQHGVWSDWQKWSACSITCGQGIRVRVRSCDHQGSDHGGEACVGPVSDTEQCYMATCTKGGGWGTWHDWSSCSMSCGDGIKTRNRTCDHPAPKDGGKYCDGMSTNSTYCHDTDCSVANQTTWSPWTAWTACSATCGGKSARARHCYRNETTCPGELIEYKTCGTASCYMSHWSSWSRWTGCSATCGGAFTVRVRHCGANNGTKCPGDPLEKKSCGTDICPPPAVDGGWGTWQHWTNCSVTCGLGVKTRHRSCDSPAADYGGKPCEGNSTMNIECKSPNCPVSGGWGAWDEWSACTETCGLGFKSRHRSCDDPAPQNGGMPCMGRFSSMTTCDLDDC